MNETKEELIEDQIASLESRLSANPDFQRLQKLKQLREIGAAYQAAFTEAFGNKPDREADLPHSKICTQEDRKNDQMKTTPTAVLIHATAKLIKDRGGPVPLADIHEHLVSAGFEIGGTDPRANLSSKLSASDEVYNAKPLGWWLESRRSEFADKRKNPANANGIARLS